MVTSIVRLSSNRGIGKYQSKSVNNLGYYIMLYGVIFVLEWIFLFPVGVCLCSFKCNLILLMLTSRPQLFEGWIALSAG